jgi:hypothetical protein
MDHKLREFLEIRHSRLDAINEVLLDPNSKVINAFWMSWRNTAHPKRSIARPWRRVNSRILFARVNEKKPEYLKDLEWLKEQREANKFISVADYRRRSWGRLQRTTNLPMNSR